MVEAEIKINLAVDVDVLEAQVSTLHVEDGDTVILAIDQILPAHVHKNLTETFGRYFPSNKVLVLEEGMKLGLVKHIKARIADEVED